MTGTAREPLPNTGAAAQAAADPDLVWHYTDGPGLISILTHHVLWATSASFLNDQQEVALGGELIVRRLLELADQGDDEFFTAMADRVRGSLEEGHGPSAAGFFILSAARAWDSLVMWRNYGGLAESYAVGLDAGSPLMVLGDEGFEGDTVLNASFRRFYLRRMPWKPVQYAEADQLALVDAVFDDLPEQMARMRDGIARLGVAKEDLADTPQLPPELAADVASARDALEHALLLIKHAGFEDEDETRHAFVLFSDPADEAAQRLEARLLRYRSTAYGIAPYLELTGAAPDRSADAVVAPRPHQLPIRAVAISPSPNGSEATTSLQRLLASRGYPDVPVLRSAIPFRG